VAEYEKTILDELDLMRNGQCLAAEAQFPGLDLLYVPEIHWDYCRINVMVMERIHGVPISDLERCARWALTLRCWRKRRADLLHPGLPPHFFHADMHPATSSCWGEPHNPRYAAVDFGIVGTLDPRDQNTCGELPCGLRP